MLGTGGLSLDSLVALAQGFFSSFPAEEKELQTGCRLAWFNFPSSQIVYKLICWTMY